MSHGEEWGGWGQEKKGINFGLSFHPCFPMSGGPLARSSAHASETKVWPARPCPRPGRADTSALALTPQGVLPRAELPQSRCMERLLPAVLISIPQVLPGQATHSATAHTGAHNAIGRRRSAELRETVASHVKSSPSNLSSSLPKRAQAHDREGACDPSAAPRECGLSRPRHDQGRTQRNEAPLRPPPLLVSYKRVAYRRKCYTCGRRRARARKRAKIAALLSARACPARGADGVGRLYHTVDTSNTNGHKLGLPYVRSHSQAWRAGVDRPHRAARKAPIGDWRPWQNSRR